MPTLSIRLINVVLLLRRQCSLISLGRSERHILDIRKRAEFADPLLALTAPRRPRVANENQRHARGASPRAEVHGSRADRVWHDRANASDPEQDRWFAGCASTVDQDLGTGAGSDVLSG